MSKNSVNDIAAIQEKMWNNDHFSQWLGIVLEQVEIGYCKASFRVRKEMLNGHGTVQGGVLFSVADTAFAFACNAQGNLTVALEVGINFIKPAYEGEELLIEAKALHHGYKTGVYDVRITNRTGELICLFKGTSYTSSKKIIDTTV
jgi:acyl-CoA thioesterase